jgi:hypothetical protein
LSAWVISIAIKALSRIELPSTKFDYSSATHLSNYLLSRFANSFETTLYKTLHIDIDIEFSHFGIKQIFVSLREEGKNNLFAATASPHQRYHCYIAPKNAGKRPN